MTTPRRRLVALLDRAGPDDLCMLGFAAADPTSSSIRVYGVANRHPPDSLAPSDLTDLIADGHALAGFAQEHIKHASLRR